MSMRPLETGVDLLILSMILGSWWMQIGKRTDYSNAPRRWILAALGLSLISISFGLYVTMLTSLPLHQNIVINTDSLLGEVRRFTRFYPTTMSVTGAALGLFGTGSVKWVILASGTLVALWWISFILSLL